MELLEVFLVSIGGTATALLVTAFLARSLLGHLFAKEMETYKSKLQENAKKDDRRFAYEQVMKRYKGPLLHAVYDLQSRLYNIIRQNLIEVYVVEGEEQERDYVVNNTAFVIAQYFAWTEIIRGEIQFIDFESDAETKAFSELRDRVYSLWQTDRRFPDKFRFWAGEQRAIGELMIEARNQHLDCIGYAVFLKRLQGNQEPLLAKLQSDVIALSDSVSSSRKRLTEIQHALIDLLKFLDPEYLRFPERRRTYIPQEEAC